jgi:hypothetical protein
VAAVIDADRGDGVLFVPEDRTAALLMSFLANEGAARGCASEEDLLESRLQDDDWARWGAKFAPAWLTRRLHKRSFVAPSLRALEVPNHFGLAVVGEWGSGLYGAPISAATLELARPAFHQLLHLGGVYYAGTKSEVVDRFLSLWPEVASARNWALISNHEMYSGGEGYFDVTLADPRFATQGGSSCFAWENDFFLFLGVDTAYVEHDISSAQRQWIHAMASTRPEKKLVLFSHHQPFSAFEPGGSKLVRALGRLLEERRVAAWYWGHEHRCVFFEQHPIWGIWGRCIGHGGYPQPRDQFSGPPESRNQDGSSWRRVRRIGTPSAWVLDGANPYVPGHESRYAPHGYVALHFDGPVVHEVVHAPDGTLLLAHDAS